MRKLRDLAALSSLVCVTCLTPLSALAQSSSDLDSSINRVAIDSGTRIYEQSGIAVDDHHILTADTGFSARSPEALLLVSGAEVPLNYVASDDELRLVLWELPLEGGLKGAIFSQRFVDEGESIDLRYAGTSTISSIDARLVTDQPVRPGLFHTLELPFESFGGAYVNSCGQLAGIATPDADYSTRDERARRGRDQSSSALSVQAITGFLEENGLSPATSETPCLSELESATARADEAEAKADEQKSNADSLRGEADAALERANELDERAKELERAAEQSSSDKAEAEAAAADARARAEAALIEAEEAEARVSAAEAELSELESALDEAENELGSVRGELDEATTEIEQTSSDRDRWQNYAIIAAIVAILAAIIGAIFVWMRSKRAKEAEHARAAAESEADRLAAIPKAVPAVSDALLENDAQSLLLTGTLLPAAAGGVYVGRHPSMAQAIIEAEDVSRRHARFFSQDGQVYVEDHSSYGTLVNGQKIEKEQPFPVETGDKITFASHTFTFLRVSK